MFHMLSLEQCSLDHVLNHKMIVVDVLAFDSSLIAHARTMIVVVVVEDADDDDGN